MMILDVRSKVVSWLGVVFLQAFGTILSEKNIVQAGPSPWIHPLASQQPRILDLCTCSEEITGITTTLPWRAQSLRVASDWVITYDDGGYSNAAPWLGVVIL